MQKLVGLLSERTKDALIEFLDITVVFATASLAFELLKGAVWLITST